MIKSSSGLRLLFNSTIFVLIFACGCGKANNQKAVVQGTVTIEGELAHQGIVTFHPVGGGPVAYGPIQSDGTFTIQVGQGKTADLDASQIQTGNYLVTVVVSSPSSPRVGVAQGPPEPGPRLTAKKYSSKDTTDLKYTVKPERNIYNIDVERATEEELSVDDSQGQVEEESEVAEGSGDVEETTGEVGEPKSSDEAKVDAEAPQP